MQGAEIVRLSGLEGVPYPRGEPVDYSGERRVCPRETTTYSLAAYVGAGPPTPPAAERELVIVVRELPRVIPTPTSPLPAEPPQQQPAPQEEAVEILATIATAPEEIPLGECAVLYWEVNPPGDWTILLDGQTVEAHGERNVCPRSTKTYELLVGAPGEPVVQFATLHVFEEPVEEPPPAGPVPQEPSPPQGGADVQPTDLFPQKGTIWTRISNKGHDTLSNNKVEVTISGCGAGKQYALNIAPGQTQTTDTGCQAAAGSNSYTVSVKAIDFNDPNLANNSYSETLYWEAAPAPPAPPAPPPAGPSQPSAADLAVTDLFPQTLHGPVYGRLTNRGPASVSNLTIQFSCQWVEKDAIEGTQRTNQLGPRNITITTLSPGQTTEFNTYISVEVQQYQYDMTCTIQPPSNDPNAANNSYSETF